MRVLDDMRPVVFETGSFTGYRPLRQLGSGYLTATNKFAQPLCGNEEGWGPLSPHRYDFTPCFIDVWVATVAAFGLLVGGIAVVWLLKNKPAAPVSKNWHFWTKQVWIGSCALSPEEPCACECRFDDANVRWLFPRPFSLLS